MNESDARIARDAAVPRWGLELVGLVTLLVAAGLLLYAAADVFLLIFVGILFAVFLSMLTDRTSEFTSLSKRWSLAVVLLILAALVAGLFWLLASRVAAETQNLQEDLTSAWKLVQQRASQYEWAKQYFSHKPLEQLQDMKVNWFSRVTGFFSATFGALGSIALVIFVAIYTAADPGQYRRGILHLVPLESRSRAANVFDEMGVSLRWWLAGQICSMTLIGIATTVGLWLLGIPNALTLGILAGLLTFIPNFGPITSAIPAVLLGLTMGMMDAVYVILLYLGVQAVESNLVTPLVQQKSVDLPPVLNVGVQVLMGVLFGVVGLIVAAPLTVCGMVLVKRFYVEDMLGDRLKKD
jgi:predicted PurR-regulated permease PerM